LLPKELPAIVMLCPCETVPETPQIAGVPAGPHPPPSPPSPLQAVITIKVSASKTPFFCLLSLNHNVRNANIVRQRCARTTLET
jgi:hypothetical protein